MAQRTKPPQSGAKRAPATGQAENWGRPSGGADFLLERPGGGFTRDMTKAACRVRNKGPETTWQAEHQKPFSVNRPQYVRRQDRPREGDRLKMAAGLERRTAGMRRRPGGNEGRRLPDNRRLPVIRGKQAGQAQRPRVRNESLPREHFGRWNRPSVQHGSVKDNREHFTNSMDQLTA